MRSSSVSLYIHIPFCRKKCSYCDFFSVTDRKGSYQRVLDEIILQIENFLAISSFPHIETIFIGGGTPGSLPLSLLDSFLSKLTKIITDKGGEFTIEVNPEDVTKNLLEILERRGVNRLSMGVQSLNEKLLTVLGRNTGSKRTREALDCIQKYWKGQKNFDIITCVPGQQKKDTLHDLKTIMKYHPDHISLYTLTFEKGTPLFEHLHNGRMTKLSELFETELYEESLEFLESSGYYRYEISNFAKKGCESTHNMRYWEMKPYFGAGPAAVSTVLQRAVPVRIENPRDIDIFLKGKETNWGSSLEILEPSTFFFEHLMTGFRLSKGVDFEKISKIFSVDALSLFPRTFSSWNSFLHENGPFLSLTKKGMNLLDAFLTDLAGELDASRINTCRWP